MRQYLKMKLRDFARSEDANVTVEFVILFPSLMVVFLTAFEAGFLMMRHVTLDRGLDQTVRQLRLGNVVPLTHDELKSRICDNAFMVPDCENVLLLELQPVSTATWQPLDVGARCVDRSTNIDPVTTFNGGGANEMVLMRACVIVDPIFPTTGLGLALPKDSSGGYALASMTAFVNEP